MKPFPFGNSAALWIVIGALTIGTPLAAQSGVAHQDPASVAAELHRLAASLSDQADARALASLPPAWEVETPERRYSISTSPLRTILASGRQARASEAQVWLNQLAGQLEGSAAEPSRSTASDRVKLNGILSRPEFAWRGPPSVLERWRNRLRAWILDLLDKIFAFAASHPASSRILFWIVLAGAVGFLAFWLIRAWSLDPQLLKLSAPSLAVGELRTWEEWLVAARQAAERGDSREAVHCAYWAGIVRLQGTGALPADRARTPREYLELLEAGHRPALRLPIEAVESSGAGLRPAIEPPEGPRLRSPAALRPVQATAPSGHGSECGALPPETPLRDSLAALTLGLERFWYARRTASREDFRESLRHLSALGCKVESSQ